MHYSDLANMPLDALRRAGTYLSEAATPTLRLGVTGLSRAGKTVFITCLVRNLLVGGRLPFLSAYADGRVLSAHLEPQPDDEVPRFDYERHVACLTGAEPEWPESTRQISELRLTLVYRPEGMLARMLGTHRLHIDIVDYPGEWLLDCALMSQSYRQWSARAMSQAQSPLWRSTAQPWLAYADGLDAAAAADEQTAMAAAHAFTAYLKSARAQVPALSTLGPGRFLMPGDLEGSPLLTFAPLTLPENGAIASGSLAAMMERRYESYRSRVVKPFFRDHFSRLDRQIVLVDALAALNHGAAAIDELSNALESALEVFRPGARSWLSAFLPRRIDRIVFAASKADHLPQSSHDRLEALLRLIVERAAERAESAGADIEVLALAALRATTEVEVRRNSETLACIKGVPLAGERVGEVTFDGKRQVALFPGDLDADPRAVLAAARTNSGRDRAGGNAVDVGFVRFRPPQASADESLRPAAWPHVRLDRALQHLLGDRLA
ncbi:MAG: YcjX family protein [Hyphomicrobiaceae bacterium]